MINFVQFFSGTPCSYVISIESIARDLIDVGLACVILLFTVLLLVTNIHIKRQLGRIGSLLCVARTEATSCSSGRLSILRGRHPLAPIVVTYICWLVR